MVQLISGTSYKDHRGQIKYNNNFDASLIKRIYAITNSQEHLVRGWQGHKIQKRWFSCIKGSIKISILKIIDWDQPISDATTYKEFLLNDNGLNILFVPEGYATLIEERDKESILLVMADYLIDEHYDEYRFPIEYFDKIK